MLTTRHHIHGDEVKINNFLIYIIFITNASYHAVSVRVVHNISVNRPIMFTKKLLVKLHMHAMWRAKDYYYECIVDTIKSYILAEDIKIICFALKP